MSMPPKDVYLVLGGSGMLGRQIAERLRDRGDVVSVFDTVQRYEGIPFYQGDISEDGVVLSAIQNSGATCVFHSVSPHSISAEPESFHRVNVEGTKRVISACTVAGVRKLIFTGSSGVIYSGTDVEGADETYPYTTKNMGPYLTSKIVAEKEILAANGKQSLLTTVIRPSGIFGPGDRQMIEALWKSFNNGRHSIQIGNNTNLVDWTALSNVADAHVLAADKLTSNASPPVAGETFFITNEEPIPFWDLANGIWDRFDKYYPGRRVKKTPTIVPPAIAMFMAFISETIAYFLGRQSEFTRYIIQFTYTARTHKIEKAKRALEYRHVMSIDEGLDKYVDWFVEQMKEKEN